MDVQQFLTRTTTLDAHAYKDHKNNRRLALKPAWHLICLGNEFPKLLNMEEFQHTMSPFCTCLVKPYNFWGVVQHVQIVFSSLYSANGTLWGPVCKQFGSVCVQVTSRFRPIWAWEPSVRWNCWTGVHEKLMQLRVNFENQQLFAFFWINQVWVRSLLLQLKLGVSSEQVFENVEIVNLLSCKAFELFVI
jgi:hypothetical protein